MADSFIDGVDRSTRRQPPICRKTLINPWIGTYRYYVSHFLDTYHFASLSERADENRWTICWSTVYGGNQTK